MDNDTFWERVLPLIRAHNMTHRQFAGSIGISVNTFKSWMKHKRVPDTLTAYDMAGVLGVPLNYLLVGTEA